MSTKGSHHYWSVGKEGWFLADLHHYEDMRDIRNKWDVFPRPTIWDISLHLGWGRRWGRAVTVQVWPWRKVR